MPGYEPQKHPRRLRRLNRVFDATPSYFLTICTHDRTRVLDNQAVYDRARRFAIESLQRYGVSVISMVLMPDHVHLIVSVSASSTTTLGAWVSAFKSLTSHREFKWQAGYFDHVLRSNESRSEKWEYIRMNPVRAGLVSDPDDWPYAIYFHPKGGHLM